MTSRATSVTVTTFTPRRGAATRTAGRCARRALTPAKRSRFSANFLWMCQGYYRHAEGYTPEWPGMDRLPGADRASPDVAQDLDYRDKEVVVIGSGATAATLVPAIADEART